VASSKPDAEVPAEAREVVFECFRTTATDPTPLPEDAVARIQETVAPGADYRALLQELIAENHVPPQYHFALLHRLRLAAVADRHADRVRWNRCRLLAIATLVNFNQEDSALKSFFLFEPEISNDLVAVLTATPALDWGLQTYALTVLTGMAQPYERARISAVLSSLRASASHGVLAMLLRRLSTAGTTRADADGSSADGASAWMAGTGYAPPPLAPHSRRTRCDVAPAPNGSVPARVRDGAAGARVRPSQHAVRSDNAGVSGHPAGPGAAARRARGLLPRGALRVGQDYAIGAQLDLTWAAPSRPRVVPGR